MKEEYLGAIGRLECGGPATAFLVSSKMALTARHAIDENLAEGTPIEIEFPNLNPPMKMSARVLFPKKAREGVDVAVLELEREVLHAEPLPLCIRSIKHADDWSSFGFSQTKRKNGQVFKGSVSQVISVATEKGQLDLDLTCIEPQTSDSEYDTKGASGSPIFVHEKVIGILSHEMPGGAIGAVSVLNCCSRLDEAGIRFEDYGEFREEEFKFLIGMKELGKIGYEEDENIPYLEPFGQWLPLDQYGGQEKDDEENLQPLDDLVEQYFSEKPRFNLKKVLFVISDFGKGKSSYFRKRASVLAEQYLSKQTDWFPVYFNLNEYSDTKVYRESKFGCIGRVLLQRQIDLNEPYYQRKKFVFFIDSLDESGRLTQSDLDEVYKDMMLIKGLKYHSQDSDRLIISTRPIHVGQLVEERIQASQPYINQDEEACFLSLYGFKKEQFNQYLAYTLSSIHIENELILHEFNREVIRRVKENEDTSIAEFFQEKNILSSSEMRRPIFGYMIYKLISNNYEVGLPNHEKLGVYLSFLDLLTKEAKYREEMKGYGKFYLRKELEHRVILQASAVLWMCQRDHNDNSLLSIHNLPKIITGNYESKVTEQESSTVYQYLAHSYIGHQKEEFYFNHQSIAEILLAEYYLKVILYHALDPSGDVEKARAELNLGEPTNQTIDFFKGLLVLLLNTISCKNDKEEQVIKCRRFLFPILASLGVNSFGNQFVIQEYSNKITCIGENSTKDIPQKLLFSEWFFTDHERKKVIQFCRDLMNSDYSYLSIDDDSESEIVGLTKIRMKLKSKRNKEAPDIDRWITKVTLEYLSRSIKETEISSINFREMFLNWQRFSEGRPDPRWANQHVFGLKYEGQELNRFSLVSGLVSNIKLIDCSFEGGLISECLIEDTVFYESALDGTRFFNSIITNTDFSKIYLHGASIVDCLISGDSIMAGISGDRVAFDESIFWMTVMRNSRLRFSTFRDAFFYKVDLSNSNLQNADLRNTTFINVCLKGVNFDGTDLRGAKFDRDTYSEYKDQIITGFGSGEIKILTSSEVQLSINHILDSANKKINWFERYVFENKEEFRNRVKLSV
ncbi:pentapeptide repeat-containing protein [Brevibacillus dissolubilis]|uniref:pentapeptide repeat-containing protein n=1 Tax=Brevibacillus dissolubilis TaxID=1844116 RepID=UPI0011169694|nr:pentapeptide repeat-containing protein [Brevibacillus dissolubilis]